MTALLVSGCAVLTALVRFLATTFNNDHFVHLAAAQQMLFGEWPTRDFIDIGRPLQIVASAAAQYLLGRTLFAEAVLVSVVFGIAAALTAAIVLRLTGSSLAALASVIVELAAFPRSYAYPKLLAIAAGLWLIGAFLRTPNRPRQWLMAAGTVFAFLLRHDLGVFVGAGGLVASILASPTNGFRGRALGALTFALMVAAIVTPYFVYVDLNGGIWNHFATALDQNAAEAGYVWPNPFQLHDGWDSQLLYLFHLLPAVALAVCVVDCRRGECGWRVTFPATIAVVAVAANFGLIRDVLTARIPDAIVPAVVLGTWLVHRAWQAHPRHLGVPATAVLLAAGFAVADLANAAENLDRAGVTRELVSEPSALPTLFAARAAALRDRFGPEPPSRTAFALRPFFLYVDRCTTDKHRLFLGGLIPEVAYLARRPFAGGGYEHYNFSSRTNQERVVDRLRRQLVPFALIPSGSVADLATLPIVSRYLQERYVTLAVVPIADEHIRILVDRTLPARSRDVNTGWPCFT